MPTFQYRALQADGAIAEGNLEANGRQDAFRQLEGQGLTPVGLEERAPGKKRKAGGGLQLGFTRKKVSFRALENFTRQLASLLAAGVPLSRAFQILCKESASPAAQQQWKALHALVIDGKSLAESMARYPETFPSVYVAMVQAGEAGGFLEVVLSQIADFQMREKDLRNKVVAALIYPMVLMGLSVGVLIFLLTFFIPRFKTIFDGFDAALPLLTRIIVGASETAIQYGPFIVVFAVIAAAALQQWFKSDQGRRGWQRFLLRLPLIGPLNARFAMTRFCRMLGTLIGSGVPLIQSLRVAKESIGNQTLVDAVDNAIERVEQGTALGEGLSDCPELFPGSVLEMIAVAEETGRLDKELVRIAGTTDEELDRQLRTTVALAEPLLLFLMAAFIGTIFIGMVIPIFSIQDYIN